MTAPNLGAEVRAAAASRRIGQVRELLERHGASGVLLDTRRDFAWLTLGGQNHVASTTEAGVAPLLVTPTDALVIAPVNEFDRIVTEEVAGLPLRAEQVPWTPGAAADRARGLVGGKLVLASAELAPELTSLRSVLGPDEHARLEWLAGVVRDVVGATLAGIAPGSTEDDVLADIAAGFARQAMRLPVALIAADERIEQFRHPLSASKPIHKRVMVVVVAERWGLHVAHTEFRELEPRPSELDERTQKLAGILAAMRAATVPGNTLGDVIAAARSTYYRAGMGDEWMLHHQGGTIGYQARERIATPADPTVIEPGMALAWNPSALGIKLEETLYLDAAGQQHVLTTTPIG